jgi:RNA polymerase sigma-70 factor (ECF subfamily)
VIVIQPDGEIQTPEVQALVARAQAGDEEAYAALYERFDRKIKSYLRYHLAHGAEAAEDLAADVFMRAWKKLTSYQSSGGTFSAWLYRIAHNRLIDYVRAQRKRVGVSLDECGSLADPSAETGMETALTHEQLAGALAGLTAEQRTVIVHRFLRDRSLADTGRLMAKSEDAVKQLQVRALRSMRRALAA